MADFELGLVRAQQGDLVGAIALWQNVQTREPNFSPAWFNAGLAHYKLAQYDQAVACLQQALRLDPNDPATLLNLGAALKRVDDVAGAIACYRTILSQDPGAIDARHNLANALEKVGGIIEAEDHLRTVVAAQPDNPNAWHSLGNILWEQNRLEDALVCYDRALALEPNHAEVRANRGAVWLSLAWLDRGFVEYEWRWRCLEIARGLPRHLGTIPLWLGDRPPSPERLAPFTVGDDPAWKRSQIPHVETGWGDLAGRTILLVGDMGLGDAIQFGRYASLLADRGARVWLEVAAPLRRLLATAPGVDRVLTGQAFLSQVPDSSPEAASPEAASLDPSLATQVDFWSPLMSLPAALGTTIATIPAVFPYLSPPTEPILAPRSPGTIARIGLVWNSGRVSATRRQRSCSLDLFLRDLVQPLNHAISRQDKHTQANTGGTARRGNAAGTQTMAPTIEWVALQKERSDLEMAQLADHKITDCSELLRDFADTAAAIADLDLLISVDTSVAHVAGAINRPVWILLPWLADWRWGRRVDRPAQRPGATPAGPPPPVQANSPYLGPAIAAETNAWYDSVRLIRQPHLGDWPGAIAQVRQLLASVMLLDDSL